MTELHIKGMSDYSVFKLLDRFINNLKTKIMELKSYGKELILDLHNTDPRRMTQRKLKEFLKDLCKQIGMEPMKFHAWEYDDEQEYHNAPPHLKGVSAVQFISTSNITIHALDDLRQIYINVFSCKSFESSLVKRICFNHFGGHIANATTLTRI